MPSIRKNIRTFLASPSDLQEEREAVRAVVDEFNVSLADEFGYQIELRGWEDTVARFGRPQHLINQYVDQYDLFIGLIWERWGTPPDNNGRFSSGFHEEFELAIARREDSGSPEIALFFKKIPGESMKDPGDDLKRVLEFRETIIAKKKILFQEFSTVQEIETLVRRNVIEYVIRAKKEDTDSEPSEVRTKPAEPEPERDKGEERSPDTSLVPAEDFAFLESFVDRIGRKDAMADLSASDVARFRLMANSISKPGNQEMDLGVHDINILFSARAEGLKLGERETRCLARLGFQHLSNENIPLWCWYSDLSHSWLDEALVSSFTRTNDDEKVGALSVLSALAREISTNHKYITRERILDTWFSEKSSARVRSAALEYLTKMGTAEDYAVAKKEYDGSDFGTSRKALECMVGILLRTGQGNSAQQLVLEYQFESLDADILQAVLDGFENVETEKLLRGLEHFNAQVRLRALKVLLGRDSLNEEMAERLSGDTDASVRNEAVTALLKLGRSFTEEEIKEILIAEGDLDSKGEEFFTRYQLERLKKDPEGELTIKVESSLMFDDEAAYFARVERYFAKYVKELRRDIDDTFEAYFEERIQRMENLFGALSAGSKDFTQKLKELKDRYKDIEDFDRKQLTRQGLDILCRAGKREDLQRIRDNIQGGYAGVSKTDVRYLGKYGEWTDIPLLLNVKTGYYDDFQGEVAEAVIKISRGRSVSELFSLEMPLGILKKTIELCAKSRFSKISRDTLFGLLNHESPDVRKAASIKAVQTLSVKRIKSILREYVSGDKYRYYNVIHWLDLGASMSRDDALKVARAAAG